MIKLQLYVFNIVHSILIAMTHENMQPHHEPAITHNWKRATVWGNFIIGIAELASGNVNTLSIAADGVHNMGDAVTYQLQSDDLLKKHKSEQLLRRRKLAHWIIASTSALIGIKAGVDLVGDVNNTVNPTTIIIAGSSLIYNTALYGVLHRGIQREHATLTEEEVCTKEHDLTKHFLGLDIPSAFLAVAGGVGQKYGFNDAEQLAAITSGALGVIVFRPTQSNLHHSH